MMRPFPKFHAVLSAFAVIVVLSGSGIATQPESLAPSPEELKANRVWKVENPLFEELISDRPMPHSRYDSVSWMAITTLSEDSIACGSAPVPFPDFTNGKWITKRPEPDCYWTLEGLYEGER